MKGIKAIIFLSCLFFYGCRYGMSDSAYLIEDNAELFNKRGKLQEAIGIDVGKDKFIAIVPKGVKGNIAEAINIKRSVKRSKTQEGVKFSLFRGNSEKVSENIPLGNYEILMSKETEYATSIRLIVGILDKKIVMEASDPSSRTTLSIQKLN